MPRGTSEEANKGLEQQAQEAERGMLGQLRAEGYETIFIPEDPSNPDDKTVSIGVNGIFFTVPRGSAFPVPKAVAEVWNDSWVRTKDANARIDRSTREEVNLGI